MQSEGDKSANPQDGKDDNTTSVAKLWGINCSRCLKERKDIPKYQQLWLQGDEWLCSECWQKSIQESVGEPAAKRAKHSSFD